MKISKSLSIIALFSACFIASFPANAEEPSGSCNIRTSDLLASFGYSASGTNTGISTAVAALIPAGAFTQVGTATGISAVQAETTITGRWTTTITQNDSSGKVSTHTFSGNYTVDTTTCSGDFSWDGIGVVFHALFVNHAKEFKSIATLPGVIIAYSGRKL